MYTHTTILHIDNNNVTLVYIMCVFTVHKQKNSESFVNLYTIYQHYLQYIQVHLQKKQKYFGFLQKIKKNTAILLDSGPLQKYSAKSKNMRNCSRRVNWFS